LRGLVTAAAVLALVIAIVMALWYWLAGSYRPPNPRPPGPAPSAQSASCPDVQVLAVPGTWESNAADDPRDPRANPRSLIGYVTRPLRQQFPLARVDVYTVAYVAQFSNPLAFPPDGQASYNVSRTQGEQRATDELTAMVRTCPLTSFVLLGFSQGAVIVGDVAARIGTGNGPLRPDQVLGVTLIADGRREPDQGVPVGRSPAGVGAEVALGGLRFMGLTMTGARPGGFGAINDKVNTICAPGDMICDCPPHALSVGNWLRGVDDLMHAAANPVHAAYRGYAVDPGGPTAPEWTRTWAASLIDNAPHPPHTKS
jgi:hypothetical protein